MNPWICLSRKPVFRRQPWLELEDHHVQLPDGREIPDWLWVNTPSFVNVVAVTEEGSWLCFRQQKYAVPDITLGIVGGYLDAGEHALEAAKRELREETGYASEEWSSLGDYAIDGNRGCGRGYLFFAVNCRHTGGEVTDDLEDQELLRLSRDEVLEAVQAGQFGVMPWTAALALALLQR